jgi:uncharacterized protein (TIGR03503 family)
MSIFSFLAPYLAQSYCGARAWLILLAVSLILANPVSAQSISSEKPSDIRIIVDISGSMKKNDPKNLRLPAVEMLSKLLPDGSKAGVWTFGEFVNMLVRHREVDTDWKLEASAKSPRISSVGQYTNIGGALENAAYDRNYSTTNKYQTHVILMTDGMVDIDRDPSVNEGERKRIINEILPSYQKAGFVIHTISLSDKADKKLMNKLALATGGQSAVAETADELMDVFLQIFNRAIPQEELPLEGNSFLTDSSIEEFTALIFREPNSQETTLLAPDKSAYTKDTVDDDISWYRTDKYDLITFKEPLEGEWQVLADLEPQSRITVVSDLRLSVKSIASNLMINNEVDFSLAFREDDKIVDRTEFLELLDINLTINTLDAAPGAAATWSVKLSDGLVPSNGVYKTSIKRFDKIGEYEVIVDVDGKTFQRRSVQRVKVLTPFKVETQTITEGDKTLFNIDVIPQSQNIDFVGVEVEAKIQLPTGDTQIKPFELTDNQVWTLSIQPEAEGTYEATIRITSKNSDGVSSDTILDTLTFVFPVQDNLFAEQSSVAQPIVTKTEPAVVDLQPATEPLADLSLDPVVAEKPTDSVLAQWMLYGVIGLINLIVIGVIFVLYRKFIKPKKELAIVDVNTAEKEQVIAPVMDKMTVDESDNNIDLAARDSIELDSSTSDTFDDMTPEALDEDLSDSLDDDTGLFEDIESELDELDLDPQLSAEAKSRLAEDMTDDDASGEFKTQLADKNADSSSDDYAPDQLDKDDAK